MFAQISSGSLAAVLAAVSLSTSATAAPRCGVRDQITKILDTKYKESRRVMGVVNERAVMEMFMSPAGTWTMLVTDTSGTACILATGDNWQEVPVAVAGTAS